MSTRTQNYIEAVEHLPDDAVLILNGVTWEEYEHLLVDMENWPGKRVTYYKGRLEVVSPSPKHEKIKIFIDHLVAAFCDHNNIPMEGLGSTTFKSKRDDQGAEPGGCFYVAGLEGIIGKDEIDPDNDPVPNIAVEIDITNSSKTKFEIYRSFGVPEIWRYDGKRMRVYQRARDKYAEITASAVFRDLNAAILTKFIDLSRTQGRTRALAAFQQWLAGV